MVMELMQFSLTLDAIRVEMKNEQSFEIAKGLDFIELQSVRYRRLDALSLENMIEVIEEILEQFKLDHKIQRIAKTSDAYMQQISQLFFNGEAVIDRIKLEHAFNEFVEHIEYYVRQVDSEHFYVFVYFVFIREMMHHLNVVEISFKN
jgi:hypothetical protein